jgi:hypothetical protein
MFGVADYGAFVAAVVPFLVIHGPANLALITSMRANPLIGRARHKIASACLLGFGIKLAISR